MSQWEEKLGAILNDPQAMRQIMSLAQSLGGEQAAAPAEAEAPPPEEPVSPPPGPEADPRLMEAGLRAVAVWQDQSDARAALLRALRPFLREERQGKVDKVIHIVRLSKAVRAAIAGFQGGGEGLV